MTEVDKQESTEVAISSNNTTAVLNVIERVALDPNADIDKLERLLAMQERIIARDAKAAYDSAMADMQASLPTITKSGEIKNKSGQIVSKYAKYEDIMKAVGPCLKLHGFSVSFKSVFSDHSLTVTGVISHKGGHQESTDFTLPFDCSGFKNDVQARGSAASYGKRYALGMLVNIVTSDEDDDGTAGGGGMNIAYERVMEHNNAVREFMPSILCIKECLSQHPIDYSTAKEAWLELDEQTQRALWLATTKGGIFTVVERNIMRSSEWGES